MPPDWRERWPQKRVRRGSKMLQLRQFDLQFAFARAGALGENIQDQRGAVEDLAAEDLFQIAALGRGKLVVEDHGIDVVVAAEGGEFVGFAGADEGGGDGGLDFLGALPMTAPPAVAANSANSSRDSRICQAGPDLSSKPMRKTRSVRLVSEMSAFNFSVLLQYRVWT